MKEKKTGQIKNITGQRFGKLTALYPTEKRQGTNVVWMFQCDCGNLVERTTSHIPIDAACLTCKPRGTNLRKDYTGQRFGNLVAVECTGRHKGKELIWKLQCDCGNIIELGISQFICGNTRSCGCLKKKQCRENNQSIRSLKGNQYGMLTVLDEREERKKGRIVWECKCECGKIVFATTAELEEGKKRSCGCRSVRRYCVYMHESPTGLRYIGITAQPPWKKWHTGSKYSYQYAMKAAIDEIGGYDIFLREFKHYFYGRDEDWHSITGSMPFSETNLFSEEEAENLRRDLIQEYQTLKPEYGFNAASGGKKDFYYNDASRKRQSDTRTDGRHDWRVYIHTNKINGKIYVGITCREPERRWANGKGYKRSHGQSVGDSHFYNAIKKYGWDNIDHRIVAQNMTIEEASAMEKELIAKYDSTNPEKGYNITSGGQDSIGAKHSDETKAKLSEIAKKRIKDTGIVPFKGKHHSEETKKQQSIRMSEKYKDGNSPFSGKHHSIATKETLAEHFNQPINQYTLEGEFVKQYPSGKIAAEALGVTAAAISAAVNGKTKQCAGFLLRKAEKN